MKNKFYLLWCYCLVFWGSLTLGYAQFPYTNAVRSGSDFTDFVKANGVEYKAYGAVLTTKENQTKGFYLNDLTFATERGVQVSFDYIMTGKGPGTAAGAGNGVALVLFDGSVDPPVLGANDAGFGYSHRKSTSGAQTNGLSKAFLSIALDVYGNFKTRMKKDEEFRTGIHLDNLQGNHVTVRGQGQGLEGYPVLISQSVTRMQEKYKLDYLTGNYSSTWEAPDSKEFSFKLRENMGDREQDIEASFGHPSYRRVIVNLLAGRQGALSGYYLNVDMIHGSETSRVINSFFIPLNTMIRYNEARSKTKDAVINRRIVAPNTFKIGFIGSTGAPSQKNIVRNISISLPFSPILQDILVDNACKDHATTLDAFENSVGFASNLYQSGSSMKDLGNKDYLDPYSFQFMTINNNYYEKTTEPFVAITDNGRYEYDPLTEKIEFVPQKGMKAKEDEVYFSIRNKKSTTGTINLGSEQFRSDPAKIQLKFTRNCNDVILVNGSAL